MSKAYIKESTPKGYEVRITLYDSDRKRPTMLRIQTNADEGIGLAAYQDVTMRPGETLTVVIED